jgi:hypothetical protein
MKIVKTYSEIINESTIRNSHALTPEQIEWCNTHIQMDNKVSVSVNKLGEVYCHDDEDIHSKNDIKIINNPDSIPVQFADLDINSAVILDGCKRLTSLAGLPKKAGRLVLRECNSLVDLDGCPEKLNNVVIIECNSLSTLYGLPDKLSRLSIRRCKAILDLRGCPQDINEIELIDCPRLISIDGVSEDFDGEIHIDNCGLPEEVLLQRTISGEEAKTFNDEWEI